MSRAVNAASDVETGIQRLKDGGVIAFPTDTLYALGADATRPEAVARVYAIKVREQGKPLPLFVSSMEMARRIGDMDGAAERLAGRYWPGALTLVVWRRPEFESEALAGGDTVALRMPDSEVALKIIERAGAPVTATSANLSGGKDPIDAAEVRRQLGNTVDVIIDRGRCPGARPSTIVDCTKQPPAVLREGAIATAEIESVLAGSTAR